MTTYYVIAEMEIPPTLAVGTYKPDNLTLTESEFTDFSENFDLPVQKRFKHRKYTGQLTETELVSLFEDWQVLPEAHETMGMITELGFLNALSVNGEIYESWFPYKDNLDEEDFYANFDMYAMPCLNIYVGPLEDNEEDFNKAWDHLTNLIENL